MYVNGEGIPRQMSWGPMLCACDVYSHVHRLLWRRNYRIPGSRGEGLLTCHIDTISPAYSTEKSIQVLDCTFSRPAIVGGIILFVL